MKPILFVLVLFGLVGCSTPQYLAEKCRTLDDNLIADHCKVENPKEIKK